MALLESSFLIDILRNKPNAVQLLHNLERDEPALFVASPTIMELWEGALLSNLAEREKKKINELLFNVTTLPFGAGEAKRAAEIGVELTRRGQKIEPEDIMIAAIAQVHGQKVVTRDEHFVRIPGLMVLKY